MAKRISNEGSLGDVLKEIIQSHHLQGGIDDVLVRNAWKSLMGNGVNTYTRGLTLKGSVLHVELTSSVLREELSYGKDKIIRLLNDEVGREVVSSVVLR
ncbi:MULTISPECIES: DUF721 domain-containing protein [unclassified Flavobacterium]|uniref:DUF721 domain-containing protein n=1 Tax=unclassified Flavobacterium TaxID=196869 RepID=UPI001F133BE2|nr:MULTISPECIES: DUF721 domain-containing protein [unclassified Flavobacterium]UMY64320.1 DUF721 domain-containing protein [Flavobacterium sp. HJ-32-4]